MEYDTLVYSNTDTYLKYESSKVEQ